MELHKDIEIIWQKRSLQDFADKPISSLARDYDLLIIDYPWIGYAAEMQQFLPLNKYLPEKFLQDQLLGTVGASYESYTHEGQTWAIPMDAAAPVASYRPDIFHQNNRQLPATFEDVLALADQGQVILPGIPVDTLMNFYMFCCTLGERPFETPGRVISEAIGLKALSLYKQLIDRVDPVCFELNPIKVYERLSSTDKYSYCPFAYGYTNYARPGYASHAVHFTDLVCLNDRPLISTIGGTGLAVSQYCMYKTTAIEYLQYVTSPHTQEFLYFENGGQPAHIRAWTSRANNAATHQFFKRTLPALQRAYLRPRYNGYIPFQDQAGDIIRQYLISNGDPATVLKHLDQLLNQSH
jgi:multiple sugar transport system substrate-binding protein